MDKFQVAKVVKNWLIEEGLEVNDFVDASTDINYTFSQGNIKMNVGFHKTSKDSIIMGGKIALDKEEQSMLKYTKTKLEFLLDVQMAFLQMNLDFVIDANNNSYHEFSISDIKLQKTIYFDGLSKDRFFDVLSSLFNCLKILGLKFQMLGKSKSN